MSESEVEWAMVVEGINDKPTEKAPDPFAFKAMSDTKAKKLWVWIQASMVNEVRLINWWPMYMYITRASDTEPSLYSWLQYNPDPDSRAVRVGVAFARGSETHAKNEFERLKKSKLRAKFKKNMDIVAAAIWKVMKQYKNIDNPDQKEEDDSDDEKQEDEGLKTDADKPGVYVAAIEAHLGAQTTTPAASTGLSVNVDDVVSV